MKYVVTGGAGFIGSSLTEKLILLGKKVLAIDDLSTGSIENLTQVINHPLFQFIKGNTCDPAIWNDLLEKGDTVIHLSATVGVNKVCENPKTTFNNNVKSTEIILHYALKHHCKVLFASSSEIYGHSANEVSDEEDPAQVLLGNSGRSAYVLGKLMSEYHCLHYYRNYGLPIIIARFFNVTGARQTGRFGMVVPTFIERAILHEPITIFGDGTQRRSFCDINDLVRALLVLLENDRATGEIFNIGAPESISILSLAKFIKQATNSSSAIQLLPFPADRAGGSDIHHRKPNLNKITAITGWYPLFSWQETITNIINTFSCNSQRSCKRNY